MVRDIANMDMQKDDYVLRVLNIAGNHHISNLRNVDKRKPHCVTMYSTKTSVCEKYSCRCCSVLQYTTSDIESDKAAKKHESFAYCRVPCNSDSFGRKCVAKLIDFACVFVCVCAF